MKGSFNVEMIAKKPTFDTSVLKLVNIYSAEYSCENNDMLHPWIAKSSFIIYLASL